MTQILEHPFGNYLISDDPERLKIDAIHAYLTRSYWAAGIPRDTVARALANSLCIGAYDREGNQAGLVRLISDYATFCYVCDVYVHEEHRRHGLSREMMKFAARHPRLQGLRRWHLVTRDAHGVYAKYGFKALGHPERHMERHDPGIYERRSAEDNE
jgi:GNAT superfamily N-acetyltransferase